MEKLTTLVLDSLVPRVLNKGQLSHGPYLAVIDPRKQVAEVSTSQEEYIVYPLEQNCNLSQQRASMRIGPVLYITLPLEGGI